MPALFLQTQHCTHTHTYSPYNPTHHTIPLSCRICALAVLSGTGTVHTTCTANRLESNAPLRRISNCTRVRPISLTMGVTLNGRRIPSVLRYFINSNSPSGGTKLTTFSALKRPKLTHW